MKVLEVRVNYPMPVGKTTKEWWEGTANWGASVKLDDGLWYNFYFGKGFRTDLGSVPSRLHGIVNPGTADPLAFLFYLIHDALYRDHKMNKAFADDLLEAGLEIPGLNGVDPWDNNLAKFAVWIGGWSSWHKAPITHRKNRKTISIEPMAPKPIYGLAIQYRIPN